MTLEEVLARVDGVKATGASQWTGRCPAHEDSTPSLEVSVGAEERVLLHCHAGCSLPAICAGLGIEVADLFAAKAGCTLADLAERLKIPSEALRGYGLSDVTYQGEPAVMFAYRDTDGTLLRAKVRRTLGRVPNIPKFAWLKQGKEPDKQHPWGVWRLPEARLKGRLLLTEGETDAISIWAEGGHALGIPGAQAVSKVLMLSHLVGITKLRIAADNDEAGSEFLELAAQRVRDLGGPSPEVVQVPSQFKDVTEWRTAVGSAFRSQLAKAIKSAKPHGEAGSSILWASELTKKPVHFVLDPYIPRGSLTILAGKPGTGKTMVACALAAAVTRGTSVVGAEVDKPGRVLMFSAEDDPERVLLGRLERCNARLDWTGLYDFDNEDIKLDGKGLARIEAMVEEFKPQLLVLDPVVSFMDAKLDMNRANEVRDRLRPLASIARRRDIGILVVAHVKKGQAEHAIDAVAGSVDFVAAVRSALVTYPDQESAGNGHLLGHVKHNLSSPGMTLRYEISSAEDNKNEPVLTWLGISPLKSWELALPRNFNHAQYQEAVLFIETEFADQGGGFMKTKDMDKSARDAKIDAEAMAHALMRLCRKEKGGKDWGYVLLSEEPPLPTPLPHSAPKAQTVAEPVPNPEDDEGFFDEEIPYEGPTPGSGLPF